jgi:hypothetical protein
VTCNPSGDGDLLVKRWQRAQWGIPLPVNGKFVAEAVVILERSRGIGMCNAVDKTWRSFIGQ